MQSAKQSQGFSLIELLLVLTVIGIISAIAIPSFLGQRRRARVIGDALSNARVISLQMEQFRADATNYGPVAATAAWTFGPAYNTPTLAGFALNPCPRFHPAGNSHMNYLLQVGTRVDLATGAVAASGSDQTYTISITDSADATNTVIVVTNESHGVWRRPGY
jgi:prepilin-type N-terminal cleavage/methylation domain-containing protein